MWMQKIVQGQGAIDKRKKKKRRNKNLWKGYLGNENNKQRPGINT